MKKCLGLIFLILAHIALAQDSTKVDKTPKLKEKFVDYFNLMPKNVRENTPAEYFKEHQGEVINNIDIIIIDKYATPAYERYYIDSAEIMENKRGTYNKVLIRKQLLFKEGDTVNAQLFSDAERNIRRDLIFKDAVFRVIPTPNISGVNLLIIAHDNRHWKAHFWGSPTSLLLGSGFYDFWGVSQKISFAGGGIVNPIDPYAFEAEYRVRNMFKTQINLELDYNKTNQYQNYKAEISRDFFAYNTRWAGMLTVENNNKKIEYEKVDGFYNNKYISVDSWLAHSFPLKKLNVKHPLTRLIVSARATFKKNYLIPQNQPFQNFVNNQMYLTSFGIANRDWYGYEELYSFREFDYVPKGINNATLFGYEINQFLGGRFYFGETVNYNHDYPKFGFMQNELSVGTFLRKKTFEQITIQNSNKYFTKRYPLGKLGFRQFLNTTTTLSFNRPYSEFYNIGTTALKGFNSQKLIGTKSFVLNLESVFYTPIKWWTSRGNFFFFADFAWINDNDKELVFNSTFNHGYGLGIRFQNRVLGIEYLEVSFGIYPNGPVYDEKIWGYQVGDFRNNSSVQTQNLYQYNVLKDIY